MAVDLEATTFSINMYNSFMGGVNGEATTQQAQQNLIAGQFSIPEAEIRLFLP